MIIDTHKAAWEPSSMLGVARKALYQQAGFTDVMRLERRKPHTDLGFVWYGQGTELFVLNGEFSDEAGTYAAGCWLRLPVGSKHHPRSSTGCTLYMKEAGLPYLSSAAA